MKNVKMIVLLFALALVLPMVVQAQQLFDFNGQTVVPTVVGDALSMDAVVYEASPTTTPIPLDFVTYQYTLVVTGLILDTDGTQQNYSGGMIVLYEDNGTPADFAASSTFVDGTALLVGEITDLSRTMFTATIGSILGHVDWTGGSRLNEIPVDGRDNWVLLSGVNASSFQTEPGYNENWDGKTEVVGNQDIGFSDLKSIYR